MEKSKQTPSESLQAATDVSFGCDVREEEPDIKLSVDLLRQLIDECRQLKLDVAQLQRPRQGVKENVDWKNASRYQLYFKRGYEPQARRLLAQGLTEFLQQSEKGLLDAPVAYTVIEPSNCEGDWGAVRVDVCASVRFELVRLRSVMKRTVAAWEGPQTKVRTTKPSAKSKLYRAEAAALWQGSLKAVVENIRG